MWKKVLFILVPIIFLSSMLPLHQAMGQAATISVQPKDNFGLTLGQTFQINITVSDVTNLAAWQCNLYFNPAILSTPEDNNTHPGVSEGPFLETGGVTPLFYVYYFNYNATFDIITLIEARITSPASGVTGSGTVATVNFTVIGSGFSVLHLDASGPFFPTKLVDPNNHLIPYTLVDGDAFVGVVDVAISEIDAPPSISQGSVALVNVTAQNRGQPTETFSVTLSADSNVIGAQTVMNLQGGASQVLTFAWDTTSYSIGQYNLTATASDVPGQINLSDLTLTVSVFVGTINVAITGVNMKTSIPAGYNGTDVGVTIQNSGQATETLNVTLSVNSNSVDSQTTSIDPGTSGTVTLFWNTTTLSYSNYTVQVSILLLPFQTANNNFTTAAAVTIPGDLNGDFTVSLQDLVILAHAYGSMPGDPNWNTNADIDSTGRVGLTDLVVLAQHYSQHFP